MISIQLVKEGPAEVPPSAGCVGSGCHGRI